MTDQHGGFGRLDPERSLSVVQPHVPGYVHVRAFDEVARSLTEGLADAGFDAEHVRHPAHGPRRNIVLGAHLLSEQQLQELPPETILYNHEQIDSSSMLAPERLDAFRRFHRWDYSRRNIEAWRANGLQASYVPIGWSPSLRTVPRCGQKDIDVLFYGSLNDRRRAVLEELGRRGVRVHAAFGVYGAERDALIARSRLVLNVQHYEARILEMVRLSHLFANEVPVVSEMGREVDVPDGFTDAAIFAPYEALVDETLTALEEGDRLAKIGARGRRRMEAHSWRRSLECVIPNSHGPRRRGGAAEPVRDQAHPSPPHKTAQPAVLSPFGVVVLGMHRSGTSALTEVLVDLGLSAGSSVLGATDSNPKGHFEPAPLVHAHDVVLASSQHYWHAPPTELGAYSSPKFDNVRDDVWSLFRNVFPEHGWVFKDPRLCVLWPLYAPLFPLPPVGVFIARAPQEVAASLHRRDGMSVDHALRLWEYYNRSAISFLPQFSRTIVLTHGMLMSDPSTLVERVAAEMAAVGMEAEPSDVHRAGRSIDPSLARAGGAASSELVPTRSQTELWERIEAIAASGGSLSVEPPSAELKQAMIDRAALVEANIRSLKLGWLEPTTSLHQPD